MEPDQISALRPSRSWVSDALTRIDRELGTRSEVVPARNSGDRADARPVHTVYVSAAEYRATTPAEWGNAAHDAVITTGGYRALADRLGVDASIRLEAAERTERRILRRPVEDLRIDFEDGYGFVSDAEEDREAVRAAHEVALALPQSETRIGLRPKSIEPSTRERSLRTLALFTETLFARTGHLSGLIVTLPKVTSADQVNAFAASLTSLEHAIGAPEGSLDLEVQVEMPQLISHFLSDGAFARIPAVRDGRLSGLHFGTFDYTAALGIHPEQQRLDHPSADFAKLAMQLAVAETGIRISDGSTNRVPRLNDGFASWTHHAELVRHSLARGIPQGWDMHPRHLPTRFMCVTAYYLSGRMQALEGLKHALSAHSGDVLDEPASLRSIAGFLVDGVRHGVLTPEEIERHVACSWQRLLGLVTPEINRHRKTR